jgi:hypothetical protein
MRAPEPLAATVALGRLRAFAARRPAPERCDLCSRELASEHEHLIEPHERKLICACGACAVLFSGQSAARFKRVPRRARLLTTFRLSDAQWDALRLPINLAFFFRSSVQNRVVAAYPSPAGATESLLELETWADIERENPILAALEPDVEALLVNRVAHARGAGAACYLIVPIDQCYKLVGLIRTKWTGLSGGVDVWKAIAGFFSDLTHRAAPTGETHRA